MSNFAALIATIQANITTNGNEEITGAVLQDVLKAMVQALGTEAINNLETALSNEVGNRQDADGTLQDNIDAETLRAGTAEAGLDNRLDTIEGVIPSAASSSNKLADKAYVDEADTALGNAIGAIEDAIENGYVYAGIATPSGTPASGKVFYLAVTAGTYTNYGALVVTQGINILKNNGTAWSQEQLIALDNTPTPSSSGLVKSGGVYQFDRVVGKFEFSYIGTGNTIMTIQGSGWVTIVYNIMFANSIIVKGSVNQEHTYHDIAFYEEYPTVDNRGISGYMIPSSGEIEIEIPANANYIVACYNKNNMLYPIITRKGNPFRVYGALTTLETETLNGKTVNASGEIVDGSYLLHVFKNTIYKEASIRAYTAETGKCVIAEYSGDAIPDNLIRRTEFDADTSYFHYTINNKTTTLIVSGRSVDFDIKWLNTASIDTVGASETVSNHHGVPISINGYLNLQGNHAGANSWTCSDFFEVNYGDYLICHLSGGNGATTIAFYDYQFNFIDASSVQNVSVEGKIDIPKNPAIVYCRVCTNSKNGNVNKGYVYRIKSSAKSKYDILKTVYNKAYFGYQNKTALFIGDSITRGYLNETVGITPNPYCKIVCDTLGMTLVNNSVSGACITPGYNEVPTLGQQLSSSSVENVNYLFIAGGTNDQALGVSMSDFRTALQNLSTIISNKRFGGSSVVVITPINKTRVDATEIAGLDDYRVALTEWALSNGYNVINGKDIPFPTIESDYARQIFSVKADNSPDYIHPSELGHRMYAKALMGMML